MSYYDSNKAIHNIVEATPVGLGAILSQKGRSISYGNRDFQILKLDTRKSAHTVIPQLNAIFSRQGIHEVIKSDNGPPFDSKEFAKFASYLGFIHRRMTPLWPEANSEAGRFMQTLKKTVTAIAVERKNWKQELKTFLRQY